MKRPAVFFDRDNTLIVSDGYLGDPAQVKLVEGAADAVARARQYGFRVVTFSNQSGVARGMFTEADVQAVNKRMDELLQQANPSAVIERHEFCPFHPEATVEFYRQDSFLRKPKPGMILKAAEELSIDLARSWVVGDAPRDIEAGKAAGCRTVLFRDPALPASPAAEEASEVRPDFEVKSLREAIDVIGREAFRKAQRPMPKPVIPAKTLEAGTEDDMAEQMPETPGDAPASPVSAQPAAPAPQAQAAHSQSAQAAPKPVEPMNAMVARMDRLMEQMIVELRRGREAPATDFSISKLLAGIAQILSLAVLFLAYLHKGPDWTNYVGGILIAIYLQALTITLLIMGSQR